MTKRTKFTYLLDPLHRRLLQAMQLGIRLYTEDGKLRIQWLQPNENDCFDRVDWIRRAKQRGTLLVNFVPSCTVAVALDSIDLCLLSMGLPRLLEQFKRTTELNLD